MNLDFRTSFIWALIKPMWFEIAKLDERFMQIWFLILIMLLALTACLFMIWCKT